MVGFSHTEGEATPWEYRLIELSLQLCQFFLEPPTVNDCATRHEFCMHHTFNIPDNCENDFATIRFSFEVFQCW